MRIPLDYYRILGLPIQATGDQLKQAHRDRMLQLPRREYSEVAIEARKQLVDEAYSVLSDTESRRRYDSTFLAKTYALETAVENIVGSAPGTDLGEATLRSLATEETASESYAPTIDIDPAQLVGALLILLELGEYELVIRLGRPYLGKKTGAGGQLGEPVAVLPDVLLTLALAQLELGREQWQQRQYEAAASSLEAGHRLLARENLFSPIQAEIQSELYKLRPYRTLELLSRSLDQTRERQQGIRLLKSMFNDRGGIEGTDDDLSGLTIDDFLRFVQQLRDYLTADEQMEIFEAEARRPSAVATYLTVYALLARGFAQHQPALVRRAKQLLLRVGVHQDVHLEQAVCALLLGQTEEASHALDLSQEYEPLAFIRERSQGAPDLLPGLCLYAERWLKDEVFPHFRDFREQSATLKDYFADPQVQSYLETMPREAAPQPSLIPRSVPPAVSSAAPRPARNSVPPAAPPPVAPTPVGDTDSLAVAERIAQMSPEGRLGDRNGHHPGRTEPPPDTPELTIARPSARRSGRSPRWDRLALLAVAGLLGIGVLGFFTTRTLGWVASRFSGPQVEGTPLAVSLDEPPIDIPEPPPPEETQIGVDDIAERAVSNWLEAKGQALGPEHDVEVLNTVLADPALTRWTRQAEAVATSGSYWEYDHSIDVEAVEPEDPTAEALQATVQVSEAARFFEIGVENVDVSYTSELTMRYDLVRQDGQWLVQDSEKID